MPTSARRSKPVGAIHESPAYSGLFIHLSRVFLYGTHGRRWASTGFGGMDAFTWMMGEKLGNLRGCIQNLRDAVEALAQ